MSTASLKITHLTSVHKLIVPLSIKWADLEEQIHNIFSIPSDTPFLLRYRDEDGDLITLNSDLEFEQVLCTGARVKFLLTLPQDEVDQPDIDWDVSSTSSFDTISEEPIFVQQETEKDEDDAVCFVDMDTEDVNPKLQNESTVESKDKQKENEVESGISSNEGIEVEIFHDFPNLQHPSSQKQQKQPEEHNKEMSYVESLETAFTTVNESPIIQEHQSGQQEQDKDKHSTIEGLSTKFEKIIQQCCKVLGENPEMLDKVDSVMDHVLENTPTYIEFALNLLNSAKNQNQNTGSCASNEDSSPQRDHVDNPPNMPGSFPNNTPLFQFRSGGHSQCLSSPRHPNVDDFTFHVYPPPPLNMLPPPPPPPPPAPSVPIGLPPPPRVTANQFCGAPPQPLNPPFTLSQSFAALPPFPGSFPLTNSDLDSDNYSAKLADLQDMGFTNREQNLSLLRKYDGNIEVVIENIISQKENSSNSGSTSFLSRTRLKPYSHRSPNGSGSRSTIARPHLRHSSRQTYDCGFNDDSAMSSD